MAIDPWDPRQYDKFQREREQPFYDLLAMVRPEVGMSIVDLGCGTGKLTRLLHQRLQARETIGIDRSASMLAAAREAPEAAGLRFEEGTIEVFAGRGSSSDDGARPGQAADPPGLIFSNAAFHWVEDHDALIRSLFARLGPGGQLAFQVPAQHEDPSHVVAQELAGDEPYRAALSGWQRRQPVLTAEAYARLFYKCGFSDTNVRLIVYPHVLAGRADVIEWMKGTLLTEYARHLPAELFDRFLDDYRTHLFARLEAAEPFFFPFKRILCWGQRPRRC
jgi:trans-aconitate 2-methyltransferase